MGRPKTYDDKLRQRIIDEAARLMAEDGYNSVSLRTLTKNVGTSTNAVYTLFGSKEALMGEAVVRDADINIQKTIARAPDSDPLTRLVYLSSYYRDMANTSPMLFKGFISALEDSQHTSVIGRQNADILSLSDRIFEPLLDACKALIEQHNINDADPNTVALSFWGILHGLIALEIEGLLARRTTKIDDLYLRAIHAVYLGWISGDVEEFTPGLIEGFKSARDDYTKALNE